MDSVAILIVTHNSAAEIGECLRCASRVPSAEVVVVDNASGDDTCAAVRSLGVRLLANKTNAGFAAAVNQGVNATDAPLLLLLNPDAFLMTGLTPLIGAFGNANVGAAAGMLTTPEGTPQTGFNVRRLPRPIDLLFEVLGVNRVFPKNPRNWKFRCYDVDLRKSADVEQPAGAFLMFSRDAWRQIGYFDEQFWPLWFEDVDFCARLLGRGFRIRYVPEAVAIHKGAHSVRSLETGRREQYWYGSLLRYSAKHYRRGAFVSICVAVALGSVLRLCRGVLRSGHSSFEVHSAVVRLAMGRMLGIQR